MLFPGAHCYPYSYFGARGYAQRDSRSGSYSYTVAVGYPYRHSHCSFAANSYSAMQRVYRCPIGLGRWESDVRGLPIPHVNPDTEANCYAHASTDPDAEANSYSDTTTRDLPRA